MTVEKSSDRLVRVCTAEELPPGCVTRVDVDPPVAVYNVDGALFATSDVCTHDSSSLSEEGFIENGQVECGWHFARFCIKTGAVKAPPASRPLTSYDVVVADDVVYVVVSDS